MRSKGSQRFWRAAPSETSDAPGRHPLLATIHDFLAREVWVPELKGLPFLRAWLYQALRLVYLTLRGFVHDRCHLRAGALTYITVLSLVPTMAFAFAIAKGFGAYQLLFERLRVFLDHNFGGTLRLDPDTGEPYAGQDLRLALENLLELVQRTDVSKLGLIGLLILVYTVIKLLGNVERSFNEIWGVRRTRRLLRKLTDYLAIVLVIPVFVLISVTLTPAAQGASTVAALDRYLGTHGLAQALLRWTPLISVWIAFTFVYMALTYTRVRWRSAILGGVVAGTLWQGVQVLHVKFQIGVANYNAIYAGFAVLPIFLVWLHVSWAVVLFGAELAAAHQSLASYRHRALDRPMTQAELERISVRALARIGRAFRSSDPPPTVEDLASQMAAPQRHLETALHQLERGGLVAEVEGDKGVAYLPARDPSNVPIQTVLGLLRGEDTDAGAAESPEGASPVDAEVDRRLRALAGEQRESAHNRSIRDLLSASDTPAPKAPDATPEG